MARFRVKAAPPPSNMGIERGRAGRDLWRMGHWRMGAIDKAREFESIRPDLSKSRGKVRVGTFF